MEIMPGVLRFCKMELLPGVLLYTIAEYAELSSLVIIELFSTTIQNRLHSNLSAFQYLLIKNNMYAERCDFSESKKILST